MDQRMSQLIELLKGTVDETLSQERLLEDSRAKLKAAKEVDQLRDVANGIADDLAKSLAMHRDRLAGAQRLAEEKAKDEDDTTLQAAIRPQDIVTQLRTLMDSVQDDVRQGRDSEVASTIKSLDVELKGLIVVQDDETRIVTPHPLRAIDAGQLSTIRMSFGSVPVPRSVAPPVATPVAAPEEVVVPRAKPARRRTRPKPS